MTSTGILKLRLGVVEMRLRSSVRSFKMFFRRPDWSSFWVWPVLPWVVTRRVKRVEVMSFTCSGVVRWGWELGGGGIYSRLLLGRDLLLVEP